MPLTQPSDGGDNQIKPTTSAENGGIREHLLAEYTGTAPRLVNGSLPPGSESAPGASAPSGSRQDRGGMSEFNNTLQNFQENSATFSDHTRLDSSLALGLRAGTMYALKSPSINRALEGAGEIGAISLFVLDTLKAANPEGFADKYTGRYTERSIMHNIAALSGDVLLNVGTYKFAPKASLASTAPLILGMALRAGAALYPEDSKKVKHSKIIELDEAQP